jgi:radical SAM superfamily enzyme YgiQ (UPF0313 family)
MKVLLIVPTFNYKYQYPSFLPPVFFPSGFAFLASALRNAGHEAFGLNLNNIIGYQSAKDMVYDKTKQALNNINPDLIGLGGLCTDYSFIKDAMQTIRNVSPTTPIVLGGHIVTNDSEYIFNQLKPNFCVIGEGEEAIVQLANGLGNGNYADIPNIGYWKDGVSTFTAQNFDYGDLDSRALPDYTPFGLQDMMDNYAMASPLWVRYTRPYPRPWIIVTARSCPFSCSFCVHQRGPKYRARSIDNIMREIKESYDKYHFNILNIMDELFAVNKQRMREFCLALIEAKRIYGWDFDWMFATHASASLDKDTLELAKQAGCYYFSYGLESASPTVLKSMNKKTNPTQISEAIRIADDVGIGFGGNFIFGDLAETEETALETLDFIVDKCVDAHISLSNIRPYPGSKIFETCLVSGVIKDKLEFYEHIDERPWNMTLMAGKDWLPLVNSIVAFSQLLPWVKSVSPYRCELDLDVANSPMVLHTGKQVYKIWAKCPHCGKDIYYRELLALSQGRQPNITYSEKINTSLVSQFIKGMGLVKYAAIQAIGLLRLYYFSFTHPIYRLLKASVVNRSSDLLWDSFFATIFFGSGCSHCNKRIKVSIPIPFTAKSFSIIEIKRRLNIL